jgi:AcrR family transcriptional regulator
MGIIERNQKLTDVKRAEILDGMEKALLSKGYDRLTIDDVAKAAEYSKKTIYSYFKSKDEIYLEVLIRKFNMLYGALKSAVSSSEIKGLQKIKVLGEAYYRFAKEFPEYMQAIINFEAKQTAESPEANNIIDRFNKETEKSFLLLEEAVSEAIEGKAIPSDTDLVGTAILLWSNINGFIMLAYKKGEYIKSNYGKSLDELFEINMDMLLRSLLQ